ncbi:hypothetical protein Q4I30_004314 [Leishmania utingensis]|uniref:Transmembrane protein n=1 Tax=Leishmania utingensis TaxID=653362 RepID=A0AAW3AFW1_9TRYP|nr:hypothetical protein MNV84_04156 [Leishmania braziliensis]CAJ2474091.1 unnamed protein product [Leishmania braziliensis]
MLHLSHVNRFIAPSSLSPEPSQLLRRRQKSTVTTSGNLHAFVMEYDHRSAMPRLRRGPFHGDFFSRYLFSGSLVAGAFTAGGVALFVLTIAYNIGKPVLDAHRELLWKRADAANGRRSRENVEGPAATKEDDDDASPVEEFDDVIEMEQAEG